MQGGDANDFIEHEYSDSNSSLNSSRASGHGTPNRDNSLVMKNNMRAWYKQFAVNQKGGFRHNQKTFQEEDSLKGKAITKLGSSVATKLISMMLDLKPDTMEELKKVDHYHFDIFTLRQLTNDNELVTLLPYILAKHGLFASC